MIDLPLSNMLLGSRLYLDAGAVAQINPRYCTQLQQVLTWPQSTGIVGGRPSSSLYFIGFQDQHVLYMDPHDVQEVCVFCGLPTNQRHALNCSCQGLAVGEREGEFLLLSYLLAC